jgi:hypothetical protein
MQVIQDKPKTIDISTVLKHPENYNILGLIKFKSSNYVYKLVRLGREAFVWANLNRACCLNEHNDSNEALVCHTAEEALKSFMTGHEQHELHVFNRKEDYIEFLTKYM